jgi:hypothetical protein
MGNAGSNITNPIKVITNPIEDLVAPKQKKAEPSFVGFGDLPTKNEDIPKDGAVPIDDKPSKDKSSNPFDNLNPFDKINPFGDFNPVGIIGGFNPGNIKNPLGGGSGDNNPLDFDFDGLSGKLGGLSDITKNGFSGIGSQIGDLSNTNNLNFLNLNKTLDLNNNNLLSQLGINNQKLSGLENVFGGQLSDLSLDFTKNFNLLQSSNNSGFFNLDKTILNSSNLV